MKNSATKKYETKVVSILTNQKKRLLLDTASCLAEFDTIELICFNNVAHYDGELKNKIFLTYSDHYIGNSGTGMSIGHLHHPHTNRDDRGYIKGVATDLDGYLKLRSAKMLNHNFACIAPIYYPNFRKSKFRDKYIETCDRIDQLALLELKEFCLEQQKILNQKLKELTGCSLLHYLSDI